MFYYDERVELHQHTNKDSTGAYDNALNPPTIIPHFARVLFFRDKKK